MSKSPQATVKLGEYVPKYEDTASLNFCRCREPVPLRRYLIAWICAKCSKWVPVTESVQ